MLGENHIIRSAVEIYDNYHNLATDIAIKFRLSDHMTHDLLPEHRKALDEWLRRRVEEMGHSLEKELRGALSYQYVGMRDLQRFDEGSQEYIVPELVFAPPEEQTLDGVNSEHAGL